MKDNRIAITLASIIIILALACMIDITRMQRRLERHQGLIRTGLPVSVDLRAMFPLVQNQGDYGSCAAFAACYALGAVNGADYSEAFITSFMDTAGTSVSVALEVMKTQGVCLDSEYPYVDSNIYQAAPVELMKSAQHNRIYDFAYFRVNESFRYRGILLSYEQAEETASWDGINKARQLLAAGMPVILRVMLSADNHEEFGDGQVMTKVRLEHMKLDETHAICLTGYDDSLKTDDGYGAFTAINSWGSSFPDGGFVRISYQEVRWQNTICYVIIAQRKQRGIVNRLVR